MKKIKSLFKRNYEGDRQVYDEVVEGCEWVLNGEGVATEKFDGTCCMFRGGQLYKRYDRKWDRKRNNYKDAPDNWEPCEELPDEHTGHWPGWVPVGQGPEDQWHREAWHREAWGKLTSSQIRNATYELVGPKINGNPHQLEKHELWRHGHVVLGENPDYLKDMFPDAEYIGLKGRTFDEIKGYFERQLPTLATEGIVFHHPDGRMVKIKRKDFGLDWPIKEQEDGSND